MGFLVVGGMKKGQECPFSLMISEKHGLHVIAGGIMNFP